MTNESGGHKYTGILALSLPCILSVYLRNAYFRQLIIICGRKLFPVSVLWYCGDDHIKRDSACNKLSQSN